MKRVSWIVVPLLMACGIFAPVPSESPTASTAQVPLSTPSQTPTATTVPPPATLLPEPSDYVDSFGVYMRFVPAGEFTMGNDNGKDEKLAHQVYLDDYYLDKYEVTNARYKVCVDEGVCTPSGWSRFSDPSFANYPVVYVDWLMSAEYCSWRGARLPTEAEWEKAASWNDETKTKSIYPWGDTIDCSYGNFNLTTNLYGWDAESCTEDTTPVGNYPSGRSSYGLFDMAGNVEEWTSSLFLPYPYDANDGREDTVAFGRRVLRGGSYYSYYDTIRSDYRSTFRDDNSGFQDIGFRCALTPFSTLQTYNVIPSARSGSILTIGYR